MARLAMMLQCRRLQEMFRPKAEIVRIIFNSIHFLGLGLRFYLRQILIFSVEAYFSLS